MTQLQVMTGDVINAQTALGYPDGYYFDAIVCCLTLCSVNDPKAIV